MARVILAKIPVPVLPIARSVTAATAVARLQMEIIVRPVREIVVLVAEMQSARQRLEKTVLTVRRIVVDVPALRI